MAKHECLSVLTINCGSSSIKFSVFSLDRSEQATLSGEVDRIGRDGGRFHARDIAGSTVTEWQGELPDHGAAVNRLFDWLRIHPLGREMDAVGHRVVHGGARFRQPHLITPEVLAALKGLVPLDPDHLPQALLAIEASSRTYPAAEQVACFDTSFHRTMPHVAQLYPIRPSSDPELIRYGFHGISYEYIMTQLKSGLGEQAAEGRVILAHLGHGASMTAVHHGASVDTTMGFTPAGGLMMGTRSGDLDPGVVLYLLEHKGLTPAMVRDLLIRRSGLLGVSGTSSDMEDLLASEQRDPRAALAVALFCYQARKFLGALAAVLGGLDLLVFTGGIGENAPAVRSRICDGLDFLGIHLDEGRNAGGATVISDAASPVLVRVMKTDEELMIARHTRDLLRTPARSGTHERAFL